MDPVNGYIQVKQVQRSDIAWDDCNEYEVVKTYKDQELISSMASVGIMVGDIVIAEPDMIVKANVNGEEKMFIKEELVIARITRPQKDNTDCT